jgi:rRNA maturation protein Nop10
MEIKHCPACNKYTMKDACDCTLQAIPVFPQRYSPQDKYASYRRKAKEQERKAQGLL